MTIYWPVVNCMKKNKINDSLVISVNISRNKIVPIKYLIKKIQNKYFEKFQGAQLSLTFAICNVTMKYFSSDILGKWLKFDKFNKTKFAS